MFRLIGAIVLIVLSLLVVGCDNLPGAAAPAPQTQAPLPSDSFAALAIYKEPTGKYSIEVPGSWRVQPQKPTQDNMKVATAFVGQEGFISVAQFDWGSVPGEPATQLIDAFLQVTGVTSNKNYKELARLPVSNTQVYIEMEYTNAQNRALHTLAQLRIDGTRISLISVSFDQAVWPRAVAVAKRITDSYQFTDNKSG